MHGAGLAPSRSDRATGSRLWNAFTGRVGKLGRLGIAPPLSPTLTASHRALCPLPLNSHPSPSPTRTHGIPSHHAWLSSITGTITAWALNASSVVSSHMLAIPFLIAFLPATQAFSWVYAPLQRRNWRQEGGDTVDGTPWRSIRCSPIDRRSAEGLSLAEVETILQGSSELFPLLYTCGDARLSHGFV